MTVVDIAVAVANHRRLLGIEPPLRFEQRWGISQSVALLDAAVERSRLFVRILHQNFVIGDIKMLMDEMDPEAFARAVLVENQTELIEHGEVFDLHRSNVRNIAQ